MYHNSCVSEKVFITITACVSEEVFIAINTGLANRATFCNVPRISNKLWFDVIFDTMDLHEWE